MRRELLYRLRNLTCDAIPNYEIKSKVYPRGDEVEMLDENGSRVALPAIKEVTVDGKALSINNPEEVNEKIPLKKMASAEQAVEVRSVAEELFSTRDNAIYIITEPCVGLELRIVNEAPELIQIDPENVFLSGRWGNRLRRDMDGGWTCNAGILPGTVLVVSWKPKGGPLLAPDDRLSEI